MPVQQPAPGASAAAAAVDPSVPPGPGAGSHLPLAIVAASGNGHPAAETVLSSLAPSPTSVSVAPSVTSQPPTTLATLESDISSFIEWIERNSLYAVFLLVMFLYLHIQDIVTLVLLHRLWKRHAAFIHREFLKALAVYTTESVAQAVDRAAACAPGLAGAPSGPVTDPGRNIGGNGNGNGNSNMNSTASSVASAVPAAAATTVGSPATSVPPPPLPSTSSSLRGGIVTVGPLPKLHSVLILVTASYGALVTCFFAAIQPTIFAPWLLEFPSVAWRSSLWSTLYLVVLNDSLIRFCCASAKSLLLYLLVVRPSESHRLRLVRLVHSLHQDGGSRSSVGGSAVAVATQVTLFRLAMLHRVRFCGMLLGVVEHVSVLYRIGVSSVPWVGFYLYSAESPVFCALAAAGYSIFKCRLFLKKAAASPGQQLMLMWQAWRFMWAATSLQSRLGKESLSTVVLSSTAPGESKPADGSLLMHASLQQQQQQEQEQQQQYHSGSTEWIEATAIDIENDAGERTENGGSGKRNVDQLLASVLEHLPPLTVVGSRYLSASERLGEDGQPKQCSICQEEFAARAIMLECGHAFDESCIEEWLRRSHTCPLCRRDLVLATVSHADGSSSISLFMF